MPISPEASARSARSLLLAIAERPPRSEPARIAALAAAIEDWPALLASARRHRVTPLLCSRLAESGAALPQETEETLHGEARSNLVCALANASELIKILDILRGDQISALPFKGVVLAAAAWGGLGTRPAGDLDILIHFADLRRATRLLLARGYQLFTPTRSDGSPVEDFCHEYHFERASDGLVVELRWQLDLYYGKFSRVLGLDWLLPHRCSATLAGAVVPDILPEWKLLVISMHACRHAWSRLIWVCDVAQLIAACPALDWDRVLREASRSGLSRCLRLAGLLAHAITGVAIPEAVLRRFRADATAVRLSRHFELSLVDAPGKGPGGRVPYGVQLLDRRDQLRYLFSSGLLRPNHKDREFLPLPGSLDALYYLVRPLRLLLDRSAR